MQDIPGWLRGSAEVSLGIAFLCAAIMAVDVTMIRRQTMAVMNWVWPITGLYMGLLGLWAYYTFGRAGTNDTKPSKQGSMEPMNTHDSHGDTSPDWQAVFKGVTHCGAGCTVGDVLGDWVVFALGITILESAFWPKVLAEFALAYVVGIVFQFFAIAPMRHLSVKERLLAALKADTLSIIAYEVGMLAWMGITHAALFRRDMPPTEPVYLFSMQIAMLIGFAASYPVNRWLIRKGWKEAM